MLLALALGACATGDRYSFMEYTEDPVRMGGPNALAPLVATDQLALKYSKTVAAILRSKATGTRIARNLSSSAQVALAGLAGANEAFNLSDSAIAVLGLGSAGIPQFQEIFDAKGRAECYTDAVRLIEEAQQEYWLHNQAPSNTHLTQNGVILVQRVQSSIHVVEKTLAGRLPTLLDMQQATARMSDQGASAGGSSAGATAITATGEIPLPTKRQIRTVKAEEEKQMGETAKQESRLPYRALRVEVTNARLRVPAGVRNQPDFYPAALRRANLPAKDQMTEDEYLNVVDEPLSEVQLRVLLDYFREHAQDSTPPKEAATELQAAKDAVIGALDAVPAGKRAALGFGDLLTLAGDSAGGTLDEAKFRAHVQAMTNVGKVRKLLVELEAAK